MNRSRLRIPFRALALRAALRVLLGACIFLSSVPILAAAAPGPNDAAAVRASMTRYLRAWQAKDAAVFCATLSPDGLKHEIYYESYYAGHQFRSCAAAAS